MIPCDLCNTPTPHSGTKLCDRCWELVRQMEPDIALTFKALDYIKSRDFEIQKEYDFLEGLSDFIYAFDGDAEELAGEVQVRLKQRARIFGLNL